MISIKKIWNVLKRIVSNTFIVGTVEQLIFVLIFLMIPYCLLSIFNEKMRFFAIFSYLFISFFIICYWFRKVNTFCSKCWNLIDKLNCTIFTVACVVLIFSIIIFRPLFTLVFFLFISFISVINGYMISTGKDAPSGYVVYVSLTFAFILATTKFPINIFDKTSVIVDKLKKRMNLNQESDVEEQEDFLIKIIKKLNEHNISIKLFSPNITRYMIYALYLFLIVLSNIVQYFEFDESYFELVNSKEINSSFLTYLAFDSLYNNRKIMRDVNFKNIIAIIRVTVNNAKEIYNEKNK